jgi:hypothetical protein
MTQNNDKPKLIYGGTMTAGIELAYCETGRHAGWVFAKDYYGQWVTLFKIPDHHSLTPPTSPNRAVLDALIALKDAVAQSGKLNGKEYDSLGIQVNNAIAAATQADTFKIVQNLEQAIKDLDEDGEIDRHNEEAIEEAARAYFSLQVEHLKRQITKI